MKGNPTAQEVANFFMRDFEKNKAERKKMLVGNLKERIRFLENRSLKDRAEIIRRRKEIDALLANKEGG